MIADGLTKPLQGVDFIRFRSAVLNLPVKGKKFKISRALTTNRHKECAGESAPTRRTVDGADKNALARTAALAEKLSTRMTPARDHRNG